MAKVEVNNSTYTQVLDGAGFCICRDANVLYAFGATTPTDVDSFEIDAGEQVNGFADKILWAKSLVFSVADVTATSEA